ncbi:DUF423 domain-containing protein [Pelagibacterium lacus]|uniref:DUF423 domain-containing protein n=1 Tax=Pelagibacterium lacus TaxID=2282655 RepID=A0A369W655_9HYPH|nr:DUF423 domain-containing protein [Pelagibacterium lacus]RDE08742.1 DUF423 domain-containing protein [Pelagibacterium lacus]
MTSIADRIAMALAGLLGASGVAAAAASSHAGAHLLGPYALIALTHAPAILALIAFGPRGKVLSVARIALLAGALLFCADLASRHFLGAPPFRFAAPLGGMTLIGGWLLLAVSAFLPPSR